MLKKYQLGDIYMGRLDYQADLLKQLTKIVESKNIKSGRINVIGAVKKATISFYDQQKKRISRLDLDRRDGNSKLRRKYIFTRW